MDIGSTDLELPYEEPGDTAAQAIGLLFADVPVSVGGLVESAYVEFEIDEVKATSDDPVNLVIAGELTANAAPFEDVAGNITARAVTAAKVMWSVPAGLAVNDNTQTPDISSILQEIVDQNDWAPGNAIMLIIRDDPDNPSTGLRGVESLDGEADAAALLSMMAVIDPRVEAPNPTDGAGGIAVAPAISTFISDDVPKAIQDLQPTTPKNTLGKTTSVLTVADSVTIDDLNVELDISVSGNNADLNVFLTSPDGKTVKLFDDVGFQQSGFKNTILDDASGTSIKNGSGSFTGIYKPEGSLSDFNGRDTAGDWILKIEDDRRGGSATLDAWRIVVEHTITAVSWTPSSDTRVASQDVYFSTEFDDVNGVGDAGLIANVAADVDAIGVDLELGTTYYWRVDPVLEDGTVYVGKVWSFTTTGGNVTIERRIADDEDDSEEDLNPNKLGENDQNSSDLEMPYEDTGMGDPQIIGVRFRDIPLEAGQVVNSATIRFEVDEIKDGALPVNLLIEGELSPNPDPYIEAGPGTFDISSRARTEANVVWSVPQWLTVGEQGPAQTTSDLSPVIEELLAQEEWAAGNAMAFIFSDDPCNPSEGNRGAEAGPGDDSALLTIEALTEAAGNPSPADGTADIDQNVVLGWSPGFSGASRDVYFGTDENPPKLERTTGTIFDVGKLATSTTYYWKIDEYDADGNMTEGAVWSFTTVIGEATDPDPADQAVEVALDAVLSWTPGATAVASDIYFGVGDTLEQLGTTAETSFDTALIGGLRVGDSYSWRIDSIEEDGTKHVGDIWTFAAPRGQASEPDPADGAVVEVTFLLASWTAGPSAASYDVYLGTDPNTADPNALEFLGNVAETQVTLGVPDALVPGTTYYWRVDSVEADPNVVFEGELWSFSVLPVEAHDPSPADGAENVDVAGVTLSWTAGLDAKLHSVYFGDDLDTVTNAVGAPPLPLTTYETGPLELGKTYYWRVDEFNPPINITGTVWSFTTPMPEPEPEPEPEPGPEPLGKATDPAPADGANISFTFTTLGWTAAAGAVSHDLYISDSLDDVTAGAEAALAGNQTDTAAIIGLPVAGMPIPDGLVIGTTYYWRVDEIAEDGEVAEGDVWSFTVGL
jgi:subtilisin-like proprotein convertase family protein